MARYPVISSIAPLVAPALRCILAAYVVDAASAGQRRRFFCHSAFAGVKNAACKARLLYAQHALHFWGRSNRRLVGFNCGLSRSSAPLSDTVKSKGRRGDSVRRMPTSGTLCATLSIFMSVPSAVGLRCPAPYWPCPGRIHYRDIRFIRSRCCNHIYHFCDRIDVRVEHLAVLTHRDGSDRIPCAASRAPRAS